MKSDNLDTDVYGANIYNQILENSRLKMKRDQQGKKSRQVSSNYEIIKDAPNDIESVQPSLKHEKTHFEFLLSNSTFKSEAKSIKSVLVKTGVFQGCQASLENPSNEMVYFHKDMIIDDSLRKPDYLCDDVHQAVRLIYETENFS